VTSAQAALGALADEHDINLVFSDVMMPGRMSGIDLAREVKRRRPNLPVLLTTGYAGSAIETAENERINVLCKPYEMEALAAAVRAAISSSPMR
jgi:DNA-binding NtrC family response regulator